MGLEQVGRYLPKPKGAVQRTGVDHRRQCIEPHGAVACLPAEGDRGKCQFAAEAFAAGVRPDVEPLHLADADLKRPNSHEAWKS